MAGRVVVVATPAVASGFALAGLPVREAADPAAGARQVAELLADPALAVVLVEDDVYAALDAVTRRQLARRSLPLLAPFPGPHWTVAKSGAEAYVVELLRQAIGYRVRLG